MTERLKMPSCKNGFAINISPVFIKNISIYLPKIQKMMLADLEARQILLDKPVINSTTINLTELIKYPEQTFGRQYVEFLHANNITPDSRKPVHFIEDPELAYVMRRYREIHSA
jgi:ubiquinone biosynthesis protein COQ4